jgi:cation:H+ antiporter
MFGAVIWSALGLAALLAGAELVVRGGSTLAARLGVSPLVIGLTIVAIGTSAPELAVGIDAAVQGNGALAVGNIAGTNTVNILLILGLSAAIRPLSIRLQTLKLDLPVIVLASLMLLVMAWDGRLTRLEGLILVLSAFLFTAAVIHVARRESASVKAAFAGEFGAPARSRRAVLIELLGLAAGLAVIVVGAHWLVDGAVRMARIWGVSDAFIGLTIVAIGTSAPELVTTVVSTLRNERDIAIGNLIGSSVYNILFILGVTCLVPSAGIAIGPQLILVDIPVMTAVAFACIPVFISGRRVARLEGVIFVSAYLVYLGYLIGTRT